MAARRAELPVTDKRFLTPAEAAELLGVATVTLYRAVQAGEFPAVKIRGRYIIPAKVIDELENLAMTQRRAIDAANYELRPKRPD